MLNQLEFDSGNLLDIIIEGPHAFQGDFKFMHVRRNFHKLTIQLRP